MTGFIDHRQHPEIVMLANELIRVWPSLFSEAVEALGLFIKSPEIHIQNPDDIRLMILPLKWRGAMADELEQLETGSRIIESAPIAGGLARHPLVVSAMYSMSMPGCELIPHKDNESHLGDVWRLHIGLSCPPGDCALIVDGDRREWSDGEILLFDSARVTHSAHNRTARPRLILIVDIDRKALSSGQA